MAIRETQLLLFDLDGTLVQGRGSGRRAMAKTFQTLFGVADATRGVAMAGKTDPVILQDILHTIGRADLVIDDAELQAAYLEHLRQEIAADPGHLAPGIPALLDVLLEMPWIRLALGTGNVEAGARIKLNPHGLNQYFPAGGFGSDALSRDGLIRMGIERAEHYYETVFDHVIVIGDTPRDIACARANNAWAVAVATGPYSEAELEAEQPDLLLPDLAQTDRILAYFEAMTEGGFETTVNANKIEMQGNQIKVVEDRSERKFFGLLRRRRQHIHLFSWGGGEVFYRCDGETPVRVNLHTSGVATFIGEPVQDSKETQTRLRISWVNGDDDITAFSRDMPAPAVTKIVDHLNYVLQKHRTPKL